MANICFSCKSVLALPTGAVSMNASCDRCGSDVRVCRNCKFYDVKSYNECREPQAERVVEKDRRNRCDFLVLRDSSLSAGILNSADDDDEKSAAKKKLDDLFK